MRKHYHIKLINHSIHLPDRFTVHPKKKKKSPPKEFTHLRILNF